MIENPYAPGTKVVWTSQANGSAKTKRGEVIAFVPARRNLATLIENIRREIPGARCHGINVSQLDRYLVWVPRGGNSELNDYYTPNARLVKEDKFGG